MCVPSFLFSFFGGDSLLIKIQIHSRLQRAQKLLKQSKQKDYYKVLGVARDADTRTIKKALYVPLSYLHTSQLFHVDLCWRCTYHIHLSRTAAKSAHPDKGGSEAKMAAVNEAYKVLSDPGLCFSTRPRRVYDG